MVGAMRTKELSDWLGIASGTLRAWSNGEFRRYLSPRAQGGDGRRRDWNETDARIIGFIVALKAQSTHRDEIHATLARLQAEDWQDLPPMPPAPPGTRPTPMVSKDAAETAISTQRGAMMREISIFEERVDQLEGQLTESRGRNVDLERELGEVRQELGRLQGQLSERLPLRALLLLLAVAIIVAVVLTWLARG